MKRNHAFKIDYRNGFSLIEMIVVMAIISVLAGITIPVYLSMQPSIRLNGAARQLMGDLMWARMQAISQNNEFRIIYKDNRRYTILDDDNNDGVNTAGEAIIVKDIQNKYYDVIYSSSNTNDLIFFPRGNATNLTTITLTNISGTKKVSVSITGRVKKE